MFIVPISVTSDTRNSSLVGVYQENSVSVVNFYDNID
jgi:hypothetical protein